MPGHSLERAHAQIIDSTVARLSSRSTSIWGRAGEPMCRRQVGAALVALEQDLVAGKRNAVRTAMNAIVDELAADELVFADFRFFVQTLRSSVHEALETTLPGEGWRAGVDDWFFEMVLVGSMQFVIHREAEMQQRTVKLEMQRLESQLADLHAALDEKTELLEMVRQASTPIAPVVDGILVVPLVGTFDAVRAEHLTEKLLQEVARVHARATILDISGVPVFDTAAAQLIIRLARSVRLLGTEILLVGMSPETAKTIIALEVDLAGIQTLGTLRDGLARALVLQQLEIAPIRAKRK
jgi:anti-anti-sigma factor